MTSFKSWLKNVHMEQLNEQGYSPSEMLPPVMLCRMLQDGETTIDDSSGHEVMTNTRTKENELLAVFHGWQRSGAL